MDTHFPITKAFFSNVDIKGTYYTRATTVKSYIERSGTANRYFCVAMSPSVEINYSIYCDDISEFENNGAHFIVGTQKEQNEIKDFKQNMIIAVDSAELKGGTLKERRERFEENFGDINLFIFKGNPNNFGITFTYRWDAYYEDVRGDITYVGWLF